MNNPRFFFFFLNLENISITAVCSGNVSVLTNTQMDLNHSVHGFGMLVFQCPVDKCAATSEHRSIIRKERIFFFFSSGM